MPVYSFGEESPIKFEIPESLATLYNEAVEQFLKAQRRFTQKFGRQWDPVTDPIKIKWSSKQRKAWNEFARIFDSVVADQGPISANDFMDDFLVLNIAETASAAARRWTRVLTLAAGVGVVYGLLKR